jgi:predicted regulator of Ras-like GTPase activity (Roadblock/LC7/MglB family)
MSIIMDAMKMKDEVKPGETLELPPRTDDGEEHHRAFEGDWRQSVRDEEEVCAPADELITEPVIPAAPPAAMPSTAHTQTPVVEKIPAVQKNNAPLAFCSTEGCTTSLESILEILRGIKGYKGSGIMDFTGETIAADCLDSNLNLASIGAVFNDVFRSAHEKAECSGLRACNELTLKTQDAIIIICGSGAESAVPFHLIAVLDKDGNQALAKIQLARIIPLAAQELN